MRQLINFLWAIILGSTLLAGNGDYQVIVVGAGDHGACKWSPDGTKLAFFRDKTLCISDTLGQVTQVADIQYRPSRFDWIDDSLLAVLQGERLPADSIAAGKPQHCLLSEIRLDGQVKTLHEETVYQPTQQSMDLEKAVGGTLYIKKRISRGVYKREILPEYSVGSLKTRASADFTLGIYDAGIYRIDLTTGDSTLLLKNDNFYVPYTANAYAALNYGRDLLLVSHGRLVPLNRLDTLPLNLEQYLCAIPEGLAGCGFTDFYFCPQSNFLVFVEGCDDGVNKVIGHICSFDYDTRTFIRYPSLTGSDQELRPVLSSDCRHMAILSGSKGICIIKLEGMK